MTILDDLIARANNVLGALEGLIEGDAAETPIVDTSVPYDFPAIAFDEANDAWTLTQDTADSADGLYKGEFTLASQSGCAQLEIVSIVSHQNPSSGAPASWRGCESGAVFVDEASVNALDGKQVNAVKIRSAIAFEVKMKVKKWDAECVGCDPSDWLTLTFSEFASPHPAGVSSVPGGASDGQLYAEIGTFNNGIVLTEERCIPRIVMGCNNSPYTWRLKVGNRIFGPYILGGNRQIEIDPPVRADRIGVENTTGPNGWISFNGATIYYCL
jgi:hypothetical protein